MKKKRVNLPRRKFVTVRRKLGEMNKTEAAYAADLELRRRAGDIREYHFEAIRMVLARKTSYLPDFMVIAKDGTVEMHEVKGHWLSSARVKIKVAAKLFPFKFIAIKKLAKKDGGGWKVEEF